MEKVAAVSHRMSRVRPNRTSASRASQPASAGGLGFLAPVKVPTTMSAEAQRRSAVISTWSAEPTIRRASG